MDEIKDGKSVGYEKITTILTPYTEIKWFIDYEGKSLKDVELSTNDILYIEELLLNDVYSGDLCITLDGIEYIGWWSKVSYEDEIEDE